MEPRPDVADSAGVPARPAGLIQFRVYAPPKGQGNHRVSATGHVYEQSTKALREWRAAVNVAAFQAMVGLPNFPITEAVIVTMDFFVAAPQKMVRRRPTVRPDLDKLIRSTMDAITSSGLWTDDSQVVNLTATKSYAVGQVPVGVKVSVEVLP